MKKLLWSMLILVSTSLTAQELTATPYIGGPLGLPSKGDHEIFTTGVNMSYNNITVGYGHSKIFGNSFYTGIYLPKQKINNGHTYYYNNPYRPSVNPWGSWLSVSKKIVLWRKDK